MKLRQTYFANSSRTMKWLIAVCLLLILVSAFIQAVHIHPAGSTDELKDCPFCQVASAAVLAVMVVLLYFILGTTAFVTFAEEPEAKQVFRSATLYSRPPPLA